MGMLPLLMVLTNLQILPRLLPLPKMPHQINQRKLSLLLMTLLVNEGAPLHPMPLILVNEGEQPMGIKMYPLG